MNAQGKTQATTTTTTTNADTSAKDDWNAFVAKHYKGSTTDALRALLLSLSSYDAFRATSAISVDDKGNASCFVAPFRFTLTRNADGTYNLSGYDYTVRYADGTSEAQSYRARSAQPDLRNALDKVLVSYRTSVRDMLLATMQGSAAHAERKQTRNAQAELNAKLDALFAQLSALQADKK